jgi:RimJ/RimL family protein N-acetyltransferase
MLTLLETPDRFEEVAGVTAAPGLHEMLASGQLSAEWVAALRAATATDSWTHGYWLVTRADNRVVGTGGFKGPPDSAGMVEIAYAIVPECEGQGYATEAATALLSIASASSKVTLVRAHTLPTANASTQVLAKCGFEMVGDVVDPDDGPVWRWERAL